MNNRNPTNALLQKIINNLDIWRGILYSIVLSDIVISNFSNLGKFYIKNSNYYIFTLAFLLTIFEPIIRFLYRDFTLKKIEVNESKPYSEFWFVFIVFLLEIMALFSLCFGVKNLGNLNWEYIVIYFFCNFGLNIYEANAIYIKIKNKMSKGEEKINLWSAIKKIFKGETEFFFSNGDNSSMKGFSSTILSYFSEQYIAYNTILFSAWLGILLISFDFWHSIPYPGVYLFFSVVTIFTIVSLFDFRIDIRTHFLNILLLLAFMVFFASLCGYLSERKYFIIGCFIHYIIISGFYLATYFHLFFGSIQKKT